MQYHNSNAIFSAIVSIGERLKQKQIDEGVDYLMLNRGVNAVAPIRLSKIVNQIDFDSPSIQVYPPARGRADLQKAINQTYFNGTVSAKNILITGGGMPGLDLVFQTIDVETIWLPRFFWGSYWQILIIRNLQKKVRFYENYDRLVEMVSSRDAVIICDPDNPLGSKYNDALLFDVIKRLNDKGTVVIFDSPYRRLFSIAEQDNFFVQLGHLEQVIIVESFSKSLGLSGQRIGFIYNKNGDFVNELAVRLMYSTNGINGFAQELVYRLLATDEGKDIVRKFKIITIDAIQKNISFLRGKQFLATELYHEGTTPQGIFAIVNRSSDELEKHHIGGVPLSYFTKQDKNKFERYTRINVSVPHGKLVRYFMQFETK